MTVLVNPGSEPIIPGSTVELMCEWKKPGVSGEEPIEPPLVTLTLHDPGDALLIAPATKVILGKWHYIFEPEAPGRWYWRWDGDEVAPDEGTFLIAQSVLTLDV